MGRRFPTRHRINTSTLMDCINCFKSSSSSSGKMVKYKLTYFPARARGETARIILAAGGLDYEDNRIELADWPPLKAGTPFGSMPVLEVDGRVLGQSMAIYRYLARETGFAGKNSFEAAQIDAIADTITEIFSKFASLIPFASEEERPQKMKEFLEAAVPMLTILEKLLKQNNGGDGYFVGSSMSWADMHLLTIGEFILGMNEAALDDFPKLKSLIGRVKSNKRIAAWIEKRPKTPF